VEALEVIAKAREERSEPAPDVQYLRSAGRAPKEEIPITVVPLRASIADAPRIALLPIEALGI